MSLKITRDENDDKVILRLTGDIVLFSIEPIRKAFFETLQGERKPVLLDLSLVTKIDSTGIGQFVDFQNRLKGQERILYLCEMNRNIREMMELAGVTGLFNLRESLDDAE